MALGFDFKAPNRPFVNAPIGAFSDLADNLEKKYNEGELISDAAKDLYGTLDVASGDQIRRNQLADRVNSGIDQLVEDYNGAYESKRFQRDAKAFIRKEARNPAIKAMLETLEEEKFEKDMLRKAKIDPSISPILMGEKKPIQTTFNEETGEYQSYVSPYEAGQDWLADAKNFIAQIPLNKSTGEPDIELLKGRYNLLKTSLTVSSDELEAQRQVDESVRAYAESTQGGNQLARKIMLDEGITNMYEDDGVTLNATVDAGLKEFLFAANRVKNPITRSTMYDYKYMGDTQDDKTVDFNPFSGKSLRAGLSNNPIYAQAEDLPELGTNGTLALTPQQRKRHTELMAERGKRGRDESIYFPTEEKEDEWNRLETIIDGGIKSYKDIINSYESTEELNKDYPFLKEIYEDIIKEEDPYDNYLSMDSMDNISPEAKQAIESRVKTRYQSRKQQMQVLVDDGLSPTDAMKKSFDSDFKGDSKTGLARLKTVSYVDINGEPLTIEQIAEREKFKISDIDEKEAFKNDIQLVEALIPLHDNAVAWLSIGKNMYKMKSDEVAKQYNAGALSSVSSVLKGEKRESDEINILGLKGHWKVDERYDANDQYVSNGAVFVYEKNGEQREAPLAWIIEMYKSTLNLNYKKK